MLNQVMEDFASRSALSDFEIGLWSWDMRDQTLYWSTQQRSIFGIRDEEAAISVQLFCQMVHPDDCARVMARISEALASGVDRYSLIFRIIRPDGRVRTVLSRGRLKRDAEGKTHRLHGFDLDITEAEAEARAEPSADLMLKDIVFEQQNLPVVMQAGRNCGTCDGTDRSALLHVALSAGHMAVWQLDLERDSVTLDESATMLFSMPGLPRKIPVNMVDALIEPDDLGEVLAARAAAARGESLIAEFRIRLPGGGYRWLRTLGAVQTESDGSLRHLVGVVYDISQRKDAEAKLRESEARFRTVTEAMPQMVWSALPDGHHDFFNQQWTDFVGSAPRESLGEGWRRFFHPEDHPEIEQRWTHSVSTGEPYEIEYRLRHHAGSYRWVLGRALPVRDEAGRITRWLGTCTDIHELKMAQERQQLLLDEMDHRVKNILSLIQAVARQTFGKVPEAEKAQAAFSGRIQALAGAYGHLNHESWSQASLRHIVLTSLHGCGAQPDSMILEGTEVLLPPKSAVTFSMAVHELCTNAVKYGALSVPEGRVQVAWDLSPDDRLRFIWQESGGPPVMPPARRGFGTRMIEDALAAEMAGTVQLTFPRNGLRCEVEAHIDPPAAEADA